MSQVAPEHRNFVGAHVDEGTRAQYSNSPVTRTRVSLRAQHPFPAPIARWAAPPARRSGDATSGLQTAANPEGE